MSKITCDICGTVYPDNATVCPICGYPRKGSEAIEEEAPAAASVSTEETAAVNKVRGGRFSNKNVKKRNKAAASAKQKRQDAPEQKDSTRVLAMVVAALFVAVLLLGGYILWRFIDGRDAYDNPGQYGESTTQTTVPQTTETEPADTGVPCVSISVSDPVVTLAEAGRGWKLSVTLIPEDTTDEVTFTSSDESVVLVSKDGRLTAVGGGTATITITCGQVTKECSVICAFDPVTDPPETTQPEETTQPTEPEETTKPTEPEPTKPTGFKLSHDDVTLFYKGESFSLKPSNNGSAVSPAVITWHSSNENVATVSANGKVTAVGKGTANISATYNGVTVKCIVRCNFKEEEPTEPEETTKPTEPEYADNNWKISHTDVTIAVGERFTLKLTNNAGETASVTWSPSKTGKVKISGNTITGAESGTVTLKATIGGKTYECIVRVK